MLNPDIFVLTDENGRLLPPSQQAAILAKYSRHPDSARDLLRKTSEASSEAFQEKWVVNYGHDSVAELATIPVCFEGVSIIASKEIEKLQRPGCSEKSTRMQKFNRDQMLWPTDDLKRAQGDLVDRLFDLYDDVLGWLGEKGVPEKKAFDVARSILPAGVRTNLALVAYPRDIAELIAKLGGSSNLEFQTIGSKLKEAVGSIGGPLIRHTEPNLWAQNWVPKKIPSRREFKRNEPHAALIHAFVDPKFMETISRTYDMGEDEFFEKMEERPIKAKIPDLFQQIRVGFDVLMDYGAFRDIQRHRKMTQIVEPLTPNYGYITPEALLDSPFMARFDSLMAFSEEAWTSDWASSYVVPMAFLHRSYYEMDLQQLYYLIELRTQPQGHISYRRIAWQMYQEASKLMPQYMRWCRVVKL